MSIFYKSFFRGWVKITEEQKQQLIKNMENGITCLCGVARQEYINSRFIIK